MEFVETVLFSKCIHALLLDDDYALLQSVLSANPRMGSLIPAGHGLRKARWRSSMVARGKRGGIRVIYYCFSADQILFVYAYAKNRQSGLSKEEIRALSTYTRGSHG